MNESLNKTKLIAEFKKTQKRNQYQMIMLSVIGILGFIIAWQLIALLDIVDTRYISSPLKTLNLFITKWVDPRPEGALLGNNILSSLSVAMYGFGLAVVIGVPLGWFMGWYKGFEYFIRPIFEIAQPIPPVAWIPLTIVWLGIGIRARSFIVFFSAFVPCVINAYAGIKQTSEVLKNVAKTCGASNFTTFIKVGIPSSMTLTFAGIKVAIGSAWSTLVAAEMLASSSGLGYMILMGRQFGRSDMVILGIVVIGLIGTIITQLINKAEFLVLGWKKK